MFGARLHPYKPSARARLVLEKLGLALRRYRSDFPGGQALPLGLARFEPELLALGFAEDAGGPGNDPLLIALAVERIGEEGLDEGVRAAALFTANALIDRWTPLEVRRSCREALCERRLAWSVPPAWTLRPAPVPEDVDQKQGVCPPVRDLLFSGWRDVCPVQIIATATDDHGLHWYTSPLPGQAGTVDAGDELRNQLIHALTSADIELASSDLVLQLTLLVGAAVLGALTDAFRQAGLRDRERELDATVRAAIASGLAYFGTDLEALRSFVIAAAELKREWDSKPSFRFLPEVLPYLAELSLLWRRVANRALSRLLELARIVSQGAPPPPLLVHVSKVWLAHYAGPNARDAAVAAADFYL